jgi:hypothetical protein
VQPGSNLCYAVAESAREPASDLEKWGKVVKEASITIQ